MDLQEKKSAILSFFRCNICYPNLFSFFGFFLFNLPNLQTLIFTTKWVFRGWGFLIKEQNFWIFFLLVLSHSSRHLKVIIWQLFCSKKEFEWNHHLSKNFIILNKTSCHLMTFNDDLRARGKRNHKFRASIKCW